MIYFSRVLRWPLPTKKKKNCNKKKKKKNKKKKAKKDGTAVSK